MSEIVYYSSKSNDIITIEPKPTSTSASIDINQVIDIPSKEQVYDYALAQACERHTKFFYNSGYKYNNGRNIHMNSILSIIES